MKKRLLSTLLIMLILISGFSPVYAYNIGDVIGETLYTDIVASINNHNIASFNYNGHTMVVAEDLRNYGFDVIWDPYAKTLSINRNYAINYVASTYVTPKIPENLLGKKSYNVLYTDIRTFVNGREVPSYNIGGITIINLEELRIYGETVYNNYTRSLDINIYDGLIFKPQTIDETYVYNRMIAMKYTYPEGMPWSNNDYYEWNGGIYSGGYGCAGFAFILSDAAFGTNPSRMIDGDITIDMLRVGDILRINNDRHSVVVLEVHNDHIIVAEGNYNSSIHWGRRLSKATVEAATYVITRYN